MSTRRGQGLAFGIGEESTWGTAVARDTWQRGVSSSLQVKVRKKPRPDLYGASVGTRIKHYTEAQDAGGTVEPLFGFEGCGKWIKHALWGSPTTTGPSGGIYTHTYVLGAEPPAGLTIEEIRGIDSSGTNASRVYEGCMINSATWELSAGGILSFAADIIAETAAAEGSAGTPTFTTNEIEVLHSGAAALSWNSASYVDIRSVKITLNNNLGRRNRLGSTLTSKPAPTDFREVMIEFEIDTQDSTLLAGLTADTEANASIQITGTGTRSMTFTVHKAYVDDVSDPISGPDLIVQKVKMIGQWSASNALGFAVAVANTQSSAIAA